MVTLFTTSISGPIVTGGGVCTMAFADMGSDGDRAGVSEDIAAFWDALAPYLDTGVTFTVDPLVRRIAAANAELQEVYNVPSPPSVTGEVSGSAVPRIAQLLVRWTTDDIEGGRLIKGRNYVPGLAAVNVSDSGAVSGTVLAAATDAAAALASSSNGALVVWRRPAGARPGSEHIVTGGSVWDQFAILASRRD